MSQVSFNDWLNVEYYENYDNFIITNEIAKDLITILTNNDINLSINEKDFIKKFQYFLYKRSIASNIRFKY